VLTCGVLCVARCALLVLTQSLVKGDDTTDMDGQFAAWKRAVWPSLIREYAAKYGQAGAGAGAGDAAEEAPSPAAKLAMKKAGKKTRRARRARGGKASQRQRQADAPVPLTEEDAINDRVLAYVSSDEEEKLVSEPLMDLEDMGDMLAASKVEETDEAKVHCVHAPCKCGCVTCALVAHCVTSTLVCFVGWYVASSDTRWSCVKWRHLHSGKP